MSQNGSINLGAAGMQIREAGILDERSRLRPLLERCLHTMSPGVLVSEDALAELLADLRLELGLDKEG